MGLQEVVAAVVALAAEAGLTEAVPRAANEEGGR
jgi:hypothetical protein